MAPIAELVRSVSPFRAVLLVAALAVASVQAGESIDVKPLLESLRGVGLRGQGHQAAIAAWPKLAKASADQLTEVLAGMDGADILACNWIRAAAETIIQRHVAGGGKLPVASLEKFLSETRHSPRARRMAYELIVRDDPSAPRRLMPGLLNDPSLELRRDAVAMTLDDAKALVASNRDEAIASYRRAWDASRNVEQAQAAGNALRELGITTSLVEHFGFLTDWKLIGPFDNRNDVGFDTAYPPEKELNFDAKYAGKLGEVQWSGFHSSDALGVVDLNEAYGRAKAANGNGYADTPETLPRFKGAAAYASTSFRAAEPRNVEIRLGCINGHKVWLNGELIIANHVFHTGMTVDQYAGQGKLRAGENTLLVKVLQNEQSDDWAQNWQFQLRVCDELGAAVLSAGHSSKSAESP
jgi:hypothetical protein